MPALDFVFTALSEVEICAAGNREVGFGGETTNQALMSRSFVSGSTRQPMTNESAATMIGNQRPA